MKPKICFVVQRYGLEVNGGAELLCRQLAEHMTEYYDVEVLTTKAIDYMTWRDEYTADEEMINGVLVRRFGVEKERVLNEFNVINQRFMDGGFTGSKDERLWIKEQGPYVPKLIRYIKAHKDDYEVFLFFTYLYYPTVMGIKAVAEKSIMLPMAHDEPFLRMHIFDDVFKKPKAFFFNTDEERRLIREKYKNNIIRSKVGGAGVDVPEHVSAEDFKKKYHLDNYIIYVGRIDTGKNCEALFADFIDYKAKHPGDLKLVLMGKNCIEIPEHEDILSLGFVSEQDKFDGIAGAKLLVLPSEFESLSIVVLEAFSLEVPVLLNGKCEVLSAHCTKSNGGLYYHGREEFEKMLHYLLNHPEVCKQMGKNGERYVHENYRWHTITIKLHKLIQYVMDGELH